MRRETGFIKQNIREEREIFLNITKWFIYASIMGVLVGVADALFLNLLHKSSDFSESYKYYFLMLPAVLLITSFISTKTYSRHKDYSTNSVISTLNNNKGISVLSSIKAFFLPIFTIAAGGSAGKEAPCADVGAGIGSFLAKLFNLSDNDKRKLMICGVSAGFAGVFGVPISGAIFCLEALFVGKVFYDVMLPALISGIVAYGVTSHLGVEYIYHPFNFTPVFTQAFFVKVVIAGLFFGVVSLFLIETVRFLQVLFRYISIKTNWAVRSLIAGVLLVLIGLVFSPNYLGLGMGQIDSMLSGHDAPALGFVVKTIATALTFAGGGVGGIITPIFFIGANAGIFFAKVFGLDFTTFAAIGVVSVLAGACNTPLAASIMATELFGPKIAPYAAVACVISFLITGKRSIFPAQKFSFKKDLGSDALDDTVIDLPKRKNLFSILTKHLVPDFRDKNAKLPSSVDQQEKLKEETLDKVEEVKEVKPKKATKKSTKKENKKKDDEPKLF